MSVSHPPDKWSLFRAQMPVTRRWAYFDHAAVAPLPAITRDTIQGWLRQAVEEGDTVWTQWSRGVERTRLLAAELLNAQPCEIALVANTTTGINIVAEGFPWQSGDNVVTLANEFPSNQYPWLNLAQRGVEVRRVEPDGVAVDLQQLAAAIDARTRVLSVSWVGFATGWRMDLDALADLAHARGVLLFIDAIQGLGVFPIDVRQTPVDFLAADGHKWLLGPEGAGLLYMREEHLDRLRPVGVGWHSVDHSSDYSRIELKLRSAASRYEGGSHNMAGMLGLGSSLELLLSLGVTTRKPEVADRVLQLTDLACERLASCGARIASRRDPAHRSGIVSFELPGRDPQEIRKQCFARHVALACRGGRLRISPHAYAHEDDIEQLLDALQ